MKIRLVEASVEKQAYRICTVLLIFLFGCFANVDGYPTSEQPELTKANRILETAAKLPHNDQVPYLQSQLEQNSDSDRIFIALFQRWASTGRLSTARTYFRTRGIELNRAHSLWMLAKINTLEDSLNAACDLLVAASPDLGDNLLFIHDFVDIWYRRGDDVALSDALRENLNPQYRKFTNAVINIKESNYEDALDNLSRLSPELANHPLVLLLKTRVLTDLSRYEESNDVCSLGLQIAEEIGDKSLHGFFLIELGRLTVTDDKGKMARNYYDRAKQLATEIGDDYLLQKILANQAALSFRTGEHREAYEQYLEAADIAASIGAFEQEARWILGEANSLVRLGEFNKTLRAYLEAQQYAEILNNQDLQFRVALDKTIFYTNLNLTHLANIDCQRAYELAKSTNLSKRIIRVIPRMASIKLREGKYKQARSWFQKALSFPKTQYRPVDEVFWRFKIAESYYFEGNLEEAKTEFFRTFALADSCLKAQTFYQRYLRNYRAFSQLMLADIALDLQNAEEAIGLYQDEVIENEVAEDVNLRIDQQFGLGNAYYSTGDFEQAYTCYSKAVEFLEETRKRLEVEQLRIGYFDKGFAAYTALVNASLKKYQDSGHPKDRETLWYFLQHTRSRAMREIAFNRSAKNRAYSQYQASRIELQDIQREMRLNPQRYDSLYEKYEVARYDLLSKKLPLMVSQSDSSSALPKLQEVIPILQKSNLSLIFYHISESLSFALTISDTSIKTVPLKIDPSALAVAVDSLLLPLHASGRSSSPDMSFHAQIANRLYTVLFRPIEEDVDLKSSIVIIPDLELLGLPFEMLLTQQPKVAGFRPTDAPTYAKDFLVHRYSFTYAPSVWTLKKGLEEKQSRKTRALVLANPLDETSSSSTYLRLAAKKGWYSEILWFADNEADSIKNLYPTADVFKRRDATEDKLRKQGHRSGIIHFATHAFVDTVFDDFSGLVLATAQSSRDDGLFMGYEISELDMNSDLVTLSACESGRGRIVAGEGVLGLPRKFLSAGAKSVLMSHWKVDDEFSSQLMPRFYDFYLNEGLSKSEALTKAKRTLLNRPYSRPSNSHYYHQHPYFWAAFTLYGQPGLRQEAADSATTRVLIAIFAGVFLLISVIYFYRRSRA